MITLAKLYIAMRNRVDESRMNCSLRVYLTLLLAVIFVWLWYSAPAVAEIAESHWPGWLEITALYLCSHVLRMLRLVLLTLDRRNNVFPIVTAHALTAFPSSFLPFKLGEALRLTSFFHVFETRQKALAVWLAERFGDLLVISAFILGLYLFHINVPLEMRAVFIIFLLISAIGFAGLFAIAKVFVYLNRHLVLSSLSSRGLLLLRTSHILRSLETKIHESLKGRVSGFLLLSMLIWLFEILALSLFVRLLSIGKPDFSELFVSALLASLPIVSQNAFGTYQSLALIAITIVFVLAVWLTTRFKKNHRILT